MEMPVGWKALRRSQHLSRTYLLPAQTPEYRMSSAGVIGSKHAHVRRLSEPVSQHCRDMRLTLLWHDLCRRVPPGIDSTYFYIPAEEQAHALDALENTLNTENAYLSRICGSRRERVRVSVWDRVNRSVPSNALLGTCFLIKFKFLCSELLESYLYFNKRHKPHYLPRKIYMMPYKFRSDQLKIAHII